MEPRVSATEDPAVVALVATSPSTLSHYCHSLSDFLAIAISFHTDCACGAEAYPRGGVRGVRAPP